MNFEEIIKNKSVMGASLIGIGLVLGTYIITNFGGNRSLTITAPNTAVAAPIRNYIEVKDTTGDGIEDWRSAFLSQEPIILPKETEALPEFVPETITEAMSVQFLQNILQSKAGFGLQSTNQVVENTVGRVAEVVVDNLYTTRDIRPVPVSAENIRFYANSLAQTLMEHNVPNYEDEITIIDRALKTNDEAEIQKLLPLENMYRKIRDDLLRTPVPQNLTKQHLDLINVFNALYAGNRDIRGVFNDPVIALMRTKRFSDDTAGLSNGLQNMYLALEPYANLFTSSDPAILLVRFAPNFNQ
jgi:hypothetical protein